MQRRQQTGWVFWLGTVAMLAALFGMGAPVWCQTPFGVVTAGDRPVLTLRTSVGSISPVERAAIVNQRVERILTDPALRPETLEIRDLPGDSKLLALGDFSLLEVTPQDAAARETTVDELADRWSRLFRDALIAVKPLYRPDAPHEGVSYMPLLLISALAFLVPLVASRFKRLPVPVVVGEILLGIVIGRSGFDLIRYDVWLQFLAEFGFAYLMFLSGLEVDFSLLTRPPAQKTEAEGKSGRQPNPVGMAFLVLAITLALAIGVSLGLTGAGLIQQPWMMALVLSTTSLGLVVPILKERGIAVTPFGQNLLLTALIADFVTMFLITIVAGWLSSGPTLKLFLGLLLIGFFALALRVGRIVTRFPKIHHLFEELSQATAQIQVRGSLTLMLAFVALSEQLGTEVILGAFLAGALIALFAPHKESDLHAKLEALGFGFFIPIFFIMVGVRFDLQALIATPQGLLVAPILIASAFFIKVAAALPFRRIVSWRETLAGGFLLSSRLSLIIAAAQIGLRLGLFTDTIHSAIICVALVTCVGGPVGFQLLLPKPPARQRRRVLIVGAGEHGSLLAQRLRRRDWDVTLVEHDASKSERVAGLPVVWGDAADPEALREAGLAQAQMVIAATDSDAVNEVVCREATRAGVPQRVALMRNGRRSEPLRADGIVPVTPLLSTITVLEGMATHPAVFQMLTEEDGEKQIAEMIVTGPDLAGRALRDIRWPGDVLALSLQRGGEVLIPHGGTVLRDGDRLTLIGSDESVREAIQSAGVVPAGPPAPRGNAPPAFG